MVVVAALTIQHGRICPASELVIVVTNISDSDAELRALWANFRTVKNFGGHAANGC